MRTFISIFATLALMMPLCGCGGSAPEPKQIDAPAPPPPEDSGAGKNTKGRIPAQPGVGVTGTSKK